jgi:hypothetical protein
MNTTRDWQQIASDPSHEKDLKSFSNWRRSAQFAGVRAEKALTSTFDQSQ